MGEEDDDLEPDVRKMLREAYISLGAENDKAVLQLASGAVGLLLAVVAPMGLQGCEIAVFSGSLAAFTVSIWLLLRLQQVSQDLVRTTLLGLHAEYEEKRKSSRRLHRWARRLFALGGTLAVVLAISVSFRSGKENCDGGKETCGSERDRKEEPHRRW